MTEYTTQSITHDQIMVDDGLRTHMGQVYREMGTALGITGVISYLFGQDLKSIGVNAPTLFPEALVTSLYLTPISIAVIFAPLIMIFFFGKIMRDASPAFTRGFLYLFAGLMGVSMAGIFRSYDNITIGQAFFATAGSFAGLSLWGYTTKKDISGWGSFLMIGLIGLIIASIISIFAGSSALQFAISVMGVVIFAGFTAYDTQKLKTDYIEMRNHLTEDQLAKQGTSGALNLFLDFILLFQHLLFLIGMSDD